MAVGRALSSPPVYHPALSFPMQAKASTAQRAVPPVYRPTSSIQPKASVKLTVTAPDEAALKVKAVNIFGRTYPQPADIRGVKQKGFSRNHVTAWAIKQHGWETRYTKNPGNLQTVKEVAKDLKRELGQPVPATIAGVEKAYGNWVDEKAKALKVQWGSAALNMSSGGKFATSKKNYLASHVKRHGIKKPTGNFLKLHRGLKRKFMEDSFESPNWATTKATKAKVTKYKALHVQAIEDGYDTSEGEEM
jgi:hypothetical protein